MTFHEGNPYNAPMTQAMQPHDPLLEDLTDPQRQAVTHVQGPLLILAGPGSGKTRVITRRMAHLVLRCGIAPWNILAITFTNKAAGEMRQRMTTLVSERQARAITIATFHSFCARVLRQYGSRIGLPPNFTIYDTSDQERAIKQAIELLQLNSSNFSPGKVLSAISSAKNELMDPEAYARTAYDFFAKHVQKIYRKYQDLLKQNQAVDFDDLLLKTVELMRKDTAALHELRERYQYVLIDEYQDTNHAQFVLAHALMPSGAGSDAPNNLGSANLCVTGDPDQSIYGWRGASIRNILEFEKHYPKATVVRLEQNYRSTGAILAVADRLIQNNQQRKHKALWTDNQQGDKVQSVTCQNEQHEAQWVVEHFQELREKHQLTFGDMAVFYRMNSLSRVIEDALRKAGIPYQIARGTAFYDRKEIKDSLAYLRVLANPADEVNLLRIINTPARGLSDATVKLLQARAVAGEQIMMSVIQSPPQWAGLNSRAQGAVQRFAELLQGLRRLAGLASTSTSTSTFTDADKATTSALIATHDTAHELSLRDFVDRVLTESGLHGHYAKDKTDPDQERLANLSELVNSAQQFETEYEATHRDAPDMLTLSRKLSAYLEQVSLVSDVDAVDAGQGSVTLMTLHAAKGLEFPAVSIIGFEDGLLPHERCNQNPRELEEERRLAFVGITRAMRFLALTHARFRSVFGMIQPTIPSRFLQELPGEHMKAINVARQWDEGGLGSLGIDRRSRIFIRPDPLTGDEQASPEVSPDPSTNPGEGGLVIGCMVRHPHFGLGRVLNVTGTGSQRRAQVKFNTVGLKTLILEHAHLQTVGG